MMRVMEGRRNRMGKSKRKGIGTQVWEAHVDIYRRYKD